MFYYFFESRSSRKDAPVVVWLTGGPGCSGSLALFYENGPFKLTDDLSLKWNDFGWDKESNLIYIDQPTGTGFSYSTSESDIRATSEEAAVDFYDFLQAFFKKHPEYAKNDFFITGESYAGHYIPAFANEVQKRNKLKQGIQINLKGIAIGNGLTNPVIQYKADRDYALSTKIIDKSEYNDLSSSASECQQAAQACASKNSSSACTDAYSTCNSYFSSILDAAGGDINYYDIRKKCEGSLCYDFSNVEKFLNQKNVKDALGVKNIEYVSCSSAVQTAMAGDELKNFAVYIPPLLQNGVKVLLYAGEFDLICNWLGNSRWVEDLKWPGYSTAPSTDFIVDNKKCGLTKGKGPLTFLKVFGAGHLVPMDQPKASLEMLSRWIQGKPL
ncbi:serine carboxypeptidase-like 48 [Andrographis paniculata]|uniref:serine carboxypeptidase-like 48 n=1 Tax=Andrographis paniculata TaxID=175694 RepID=UPI0021E7E701|nr:serine carboxypeptidase-like 48 [Andrographis paniculata]